MSAVERFMRYVDVRPNGCWLWTGYISRYGQFSIGGRSRSAHRVAHEMFVGPIPAGRLVLHSCDNPPCVNPEHLRAGTQRDNRRDAVIRRRTARGERNAAAKLTDAQFAAIPRRVAAGERQADIAREFGVSRQAIRQYLNRYAAGLEHR